MQLNVVISSKFTSNFFGIPFDCISKHMFCLLDYVTQTFLSVPYQAQTGMSVLR